jgi:Ca2+/H+ antiporter, TMEM165/GDT1 family
MAEASGYLAVLLAAATPWVEVLFVVPIGIAAGLDPVGVAAVAFVGNAVPVVAIVVAGDRLLSWWERRRRRAARKSRRAERGRQLLQKYGIPGLALLGPLFTGAHLAAVIAAVLRPRRTRLIAWMCGSLAVWTAGLAVFAAVATELVRA